MTVAALYIDPKKGPYARMKGVEAYGLPDRDATTYEGPWPVVAHPPCAFWGTFKKRAEDKLRRMLAEGDTSRVNEKACAPRAVEQVRRWGGVLEHPFASTLWPEMGLPKPGKGKGKDAHGCWTLQVDQARWGHPASKMTRLYICGVEPEDVPALPPPRAPTHVIAPRKGRVHMTAAEQARTLPDLPKSKRHLTPPAFAAWLVELASKAAPRGPKGST